MKNELQREVRTGEIKIRDFDPEEVKENGRKYLRIVFKDLGIRDAVSDYDLGRFLIYVKRYYAGLTFDDIVEMFELVVVGKLSGVKEHYGKWSASFYCSVINAYIAYKAKQFQRKDLDALPPAPKITPEKRRQLRSEFETSMVNSFEKLKETGRIKPININLTVYEYWSAAGELPELEITEEDRQRAVIYLLENRTSTNKFLGVRASQQQKERQSRLFAMSRDVRKLYDKWIEEGIDIRDKLNKYNP